MTASATGTTRFCIVWLGFFSRLGRKRRTALPRAARRRSPLLLQDHMLGAARALRVVGPVGSIRLLQTVGLLRTHSLVIAIVAHLVFILGVILGVRCLVVAIGFVGLAIFAILDVVLDPLLRICQTAVVRIARDVLVDADQPLRPGHLGGRRIIGPGGAGRAKKLGPRPLRPTI